MEVRCPFCRESIASRKDGVRCSRCATPHHQACWDENQGQCTVAGCAGRRALAFSRRAASRVVLAAGRTAVAHTARILGGKAAVALLLLTIGVVVGASELAAVRALASHEARLGAGLGGLFLVLWGWIAVLCYRGTRLEHDLRLQVAGEGLDSYYRRLMNGLGMGVGEGVASGGCEPGCMALDGEAILLLPVIILAAAALGIVLVTVGPLLAWLAVELIYPLVALLVYWLLFSALGLAVHAEGTREHLPRALLRATLYASLYTGLIGLVVEGAYRLLLVR